MIKPPHLRTKFDLARIEKAEIKRRRKAARRLAEAFRNRGKK